MKEKGLYGLIPPLITPFTATGELDLEALGQILEFTKPYVHGYYVAGTYGQGPLMDLNERLRLVEKITEHIRGTKQVVVHVGSPETSVSTKLARHAEEVGATAVASVPPYYYRHSEEAVVKFFEELVNSTSLPVYVYNNPSRVGYPVSPELAAKLKQIGVRGVKDSSFDVINYTSYKIYAGDDFDVVVGTEALMLPTYVLGAKAYIPGMSNYLPELVYELFTTLEGGEYGRARELQMKVNKIREELHKLGNIISLTYLVLNLRGLKECYPKKPFLPARKDLKESIKKIISEYIE
ncbi:MAG: dihydrodipicolinate synthase family protein [Infirmifilum sp.]